jgi:hypothetical protein
MVRKNFNHSGKLQRTIEIQSIAAVPKLYAAARLAATFKQRQAKNDLVNSY